MTWLFSKALVEACENSRCSQEQAAGYSAATCSDGAPSAQLNVMPTPHKFWRNDKTMEASQLSRFGLTCAVLTEDHGEALLTWFRAGFRVRTSAQREMAPASTASAPGFGERWHESSVRYDPDSSSWRTHRCLWDEALPWSSVTLPNWGMTRAGVLWEPPMSGRPISGTESGLWPTQKANDAEKRGNFDVNNPRNGLPAAVKRWSTPTRRDHKGGANWGNRQRQGEPRPTSDMTLPDQVLSIDGGGQLNPTWVEWLMGWPSGWTDLKPLEMAKSHEWQQQHSPTYHKAGSDAA